MTVAGISGNVLYTLRAVPPPPAVLAPDAARLELPVEITLARCEAHALIEAKLRHRFPLWAGAGDRPADPSPWRPRARGAGSSMTCSRAASPKADRPARAPT